MYAALDGMEERVQEMAAPLQRFALYLECALAETGPFSRHIAGRDAVATRLMNRLPVDLMHRTLRQVLGIPR